MMFKNIIKYLFLPAVLIAAGFIFGGEGWQVIDSSPKKPQSKTDEKKNIRTIEIIGTDQMKFVVKEDKKRIDTGGSIKVFNGEKYLMLNDIHAEPGEQLRVRLKTISQLPGKMMSHNWVLLAKEADPQAFVNASTRENNYIPPEREEDIIAYTNLASDGEVVEVTFTVPKDTGRYSYLCSFMAHFAAGMKGELIVE